VDHVLRSKGRVNAARTSIIRGIIELGEFH